MLSKTQVKSLATKINAKVDIPFIGETGEEKILEIVLTKLDNKVAEKLPPALQDVWNKLDDGISQEEGDELAAKVAELANKKINIPLLSEQKEEQLLSKFIKALIEVAVSKLPN